MLRSVTLFLIRHSTAVLTLAVVWAVAGLWIVMRTPMDAVPDLSENQVLVHADWPGQCPPEIERRVTRPLAMALQGIDGVRTVRGSSDVGYSLLHLIFEDSVSFDEARRRTAGQLAEAKLDLPAGVNPRLAADGIPTGQIFWYTVEGTNADLAELRQLQDTVIAPQLRSVPGVAEIANVGGFVAEYHVEVDMTRLTQFGLTLTDLESALVTLTRPSGGQLAQTSTSEFLVRTVQPQGNADTNMSQNSDQRFADQIRTLEEGLLPLDNGRSVRLDQVARVVVGTAPRHGVFEKDGNEAVAGIVHLRFNHNPLVVTRAVTRRLQEIGDGLPAGVRLTPCYDRTPLIQGAIETVTRTLLESLMVTSICVILVMRHWRTSLVIVGTLPLVVLGSFLGMAALRAAGIADIQTNIMSLAGIVVSIGVLVDSSIVVADNVTHQLRRQFGHNPVQGDVSEIVADACATVGKPVFLAMLMMVVSFLPVFALQGIDGRMYRPLAWTKTLALLSAAFLTVTLVPVLCAKLIRGRVRDESESAIVRSVVSVYRPVLSYLMDNSLPLLLLLAATLIAGAAATGVDLLVRGAVLISVGTLWFVDFRREGNASHYSAKSQLKKWSCTAGIIILALVLQSSMRPIGLALRLPLDEGMVMDMPITVPRVSVLQAVDDLKARNMVLCRFPEVRMVMGKAGRADTPFDPAPIDMIETMVEFRPRDHWPSRRILRFDAERSARQTLAALCDSGLIEPPTNAVAALPEIIDAALVRFDAIQREVCWQQIQLTQVELSRELATTLVADVVQRLASSHALSHPLTEVDIGSLAADLPVADVRRLGQQIGTSEIHVLLRELRLRLHERGDLRPEPIDEAQLQSWVARSTNVLKQMIGLGAAPLEQEIQSRLLAEADRKWSSLIVQLNADLRRRAPTTWVQVVCSEVFARYAIVDENLASTWKQVMNARYGSGKKGTHHSGSEHVGLPSFSPLPAIDPHPAYEAIVRQMTSELASRLWLWPHDSESLNQMGGEMDLAVQMPGWANVWTKPIQNRVDMLATGVNSEVGIRVLGQNLEAVAKASEEIAEELRRIPGAADVLADPIRGKGYVTVVPDPKRASNEGVALADIDLIVATSNTGRIVGQVDEGVISRPLRLKFANTGEDPQQGLRQLVVPRRVATTNESRPMTQGPVDVVALANVASVRIHDGPATIKSENGWLRNYVRLNVRGRDPADFVAAAQKHIQQTIHLPDGVFVEWTGQFEHSVRTRQMMLWMVPVALTLILGLLYLAFHDIVDTGLMLLSVPGALAGGVICQWILGYPFSVAVGIGYIACFGMAAATSMVMVVYLRQAVDEAGGLERMSLADLREAVMRGAVHRLRPKLLTEATTILGLAPMLWSSGMGADVIRPMAAPVLGGILIADEVVDLLLPIVFYAVRRRRWQKLAPCPTLPTEVLE
eukprot:TRINITY_DN903_c0_g2_i3.p1 TRINITY_DN903_c0_g2~~TRINITY_DN903_c0_g2_i3.p1  ORF type:complete len:1428 (-),score=326.31 TRINITY_DN903_c0_g2_i3:23552-27835(-)